MPIAGRTTELALIDSALAALRAGTGGIVLLEGEAGIGKTALLGHAVAGAGEGGLAVLRAAGGLLDGLRPCGPLVDALTPGPHGAPEVRAAADAVRRVTGAPPEPDRVSPLQGSPAQRAVLVDALADLAVAWTSQGPVLLVLDDLHWAEPTTHVALARLLRVTASAPLTVLAAYRPVPRVVELVALARAVAEGGGRVVVLGPLDRSAAREVLADTLGTTVTDPRVLAADDRVGGNPFLIKEFAGAPDHVRRAALVDRMLAVGPDGRDLLRVAALLGPVVVLDELALAVGRPVADLLPALEEATAAGILVTDGTGHRFRHDLLREAVEETVDAATRAAVHRDVGHRLAATGAEPRRSAAHMLRGARPGDTGAATVLHDAARDVLGLAPGTAADLLERAVALCAAQDPARDAMLVDLVDARTWSGRTQDAVDLARDVLRRPVDPLVEARLHEAAARGLAVLGRPAEAIAHTERIPGGPAGRPGWGRAMAAFFRVFSLDLDAAVTDARAALAQDPDPWAETLAHQVLSWVDVVRGYYARAVGHCDAAVRAADRSVDGGAHRLLPHLFRGLALLNCRRDEDAAASLLRGRELGEALGIAWAAPFYHYAEALRHWTTGAWDDLLAECEAGLAHAADHGTWLAAPFGYATAAAAHLFRGDADRAGALLSAGEELLARGGAQYGLEWSVWIRALHCEAGGDPATALAVLDGAHGAARGMQAGAALSLFGPDLVRLALAAGRRDLAEAATADLRAGDGDARLSVDLLVLRCEGLLADDPAPILEAGRRRGATAGALDTVLDAEALLLVALRRDPLRAGEELRRCLDACAAADLGLVADRARRAAAAAGLAVRPVWTRRDRPVTGIGSLTDTERRVAELVARGASNPEIAAELVISRRTVESHLYRVFGKLEVRNRTELALVVQRSAGT